MTTQIVNKTKLRELVDSYESHGISRVVVGSDVSHSTIRDALAGRVPGVKSQKKLAKFFDMKVEDLFPFVEIENKAA